MPQNSYTVRLL